MKIIADGFEFFFTDAIDAFIFDETDSSKPHFHGLPMKGVDIVVEFQLDYVFVEIKDYDDIHQFDERQAVDEADKKERLHHFRWLKNYLKYKYRDTYLCLHAEDKVNKPIHYVCLINFDNAINGRLKKDLAIHLPVGQRRRWTRSIVTSCQVVNLNLWATVFPMWPVTRISVPPTPPASAGATP